MTSASAPLSLGRIDAHHHVWRLARGDYGWLTPGLTSIFRDFALDELRPLLVDANVAATAIVQAAPTVAKTEFLLEVARGSGGIVRGVVGWADLAAPDAATVLARPARDPLLRAIRPMLQDLPDPDWILRPDVGEALDALPRLGLAFDALVKPAQLTALLRLLDRRPELAVVVDHGAKPPIAQQRWRPWADLIAAVARHEGVHCKLSGLVAETPAGWIADDLRSYVDHLLACFGPERLIWGNDWPVVELAGGYRRWLAATETLLAGVGLNEREAILGGNARSFYGLDRLQR